MNQSQVRIIANSKFLSVDHVCPESDAVDYLRNLRRNIDTMWERNHGIDDERGGTIETIKIPIQ